MGKLGFETASCRICDKCVIINAGEDVLCFNCKERKASDWTCPVCSAVFRDEAECAEHECFCKKESEVKDEWKCKMGGSCEFVADCGTCHKCGKHYDPVSHGKPSYSIEFTEEERDGLIKIVEESFMRWLDSGPCSPLGLKRQKEFKTSILAKLRKPKKESVEVKIDLYTSLRIHPDIIAIDRRYDGQVDCMKINRGTFERIIANYEARKDEVKDG